VYERFTEHARLAVVLSQDEAKALDHDDIGTEHLLLGLLGVRNGLAAAVLESLGVTHDAACRAVVQMVGRGDTPVGHLIPFTPRSKRVLQLTLREAEDLGSESIDTEHILLALASEGEAVAARLLLREFGVSSEQIRSEVLGRVAR
jgi:ATP-dependent Clp protease ATP-binding subunit ClpC